MKRDGHTEDLVHVTLPGGVERSVPRGTPVRELAPEGNVLASAPLVAMLDHRYRDLATPVENDGPITFATLGTPDGARAYRHGLAFVLTIAAAGCFPERRVALEHSLGGCLYGRLRGGRELSRHDAARLQDEMRRLVAADLPIEPVEVPTEEARRIFSQAGDQAKLKLLVDWPRDTVRLHRCAGIHALFPVPIVDRTGLLAQFELRSYPPGFILRLPDPSRPDGLGVTGDRTNLFRIFYEYARWSEVLGAETAGDLNEIAALDRWEMLIWVAEALHEKKLAAIADGIVERRPQPRIILIAGPSSSGKTTFSRRLAIQLRVLGKKTETISIDNYFVDREATPRDANGDYNFEALEAIDVELFNQHLLQLLEGGTVAIPRFDFRTGKRSEGRSLRLGPQQPLIVEGIHALNDAVTPAYPAHMKYKIYVSALTHLSVDDQNAISTSDVRLVRRIVRDWARRGYSAAETIARWPSVRTGERQYIFPYQESADVMFNSASIYELNALKETAVAALETVGREEPEYAEACRVLDLLELFRAAPNDSVPATSILREFLGGSAFRGVR